MLNNIFPLPDFLYILQLEEYETDRYFKRLKKFFWRRAFQKRGELVYTKRIKITLLTALIPSIILFPLTPVWVGLANALLSSYFNRIKANIREKAKKYFAKYGKNTKVIAIAGSYGKTTIKNYIYELIRYNYKTQMIPGNINTPIGIANWILENFDPSSEFLIVEVDSYFVGEIRQSLSITPPDIAILTNTADQHLERLGSRSAWHKALNEVFKYAKPEAIKIRDKKSNLDYALHVAKILKIPKDITRDTVKKLEAPERRRKLIKMHGFEVIDDSYNISLTTAKPAIEYANNLAKSKRKKLLVITGGIPELGKENALDNKKLGEFIKKNADEIVVLKTIFEKDLGIIGDRAGSMNEAWEIISKNYSPRKYVVLMQPELNDLYFL